MRIVAFTLALLLSTMPLRADPGAIQGVISSQIEAFKADDFEEAFSYASPSIQGLFGSPSRFGTMVRQGYPMVWRPARVEFLDLVEPRGRPMQQVRITDATGVEHLLAYFMEKGPEGWRIDGVQMLRVPDVGV